MSAAIESPSGAVRQANADLAGALLFFAIVLMTWISLAPFQDRSAADLAGIAETGSLVSQLVYSLAFVLVAAFVIVNEPKVLASLLNPVYVATLLWMLVCAALSDQPLLSLRRTLLLLIVIGISAMLMALPRSMRQFADLIGTATLVALVVCYLGLALVPWLAIHQASDAVEPGHAGAWRGLFDHKNEAGASMVLFLFIGLFIIRAGSQAMGWLIAVLSVVFLAFTAAKTPFALLLPVLAAAEVFIRTRSRALRLALTFGVVGLLNAFTVGASFPGPAQNLIIDVMPDPTYTGRTDLWRFALDNIAARPVAGHGFGAFWKTQELVAREPPAYISEGNGDNWVAELGTDSHNAYVETAISFGVPGFILVLVWVIYSPLRDFENMIPVATNAIMSQLFVRVWLYGLYSSVFETILFTRFSPFWVLMVMAMFGMKLMTRFKIAPG